MNGQEFITRVIRPSQRALVQYRVFGGSASDLIPIASFWSSSYPQRVQDDRTYFYTPALRTYGKSLVIGSFVVWADIDNPALPDLPLPPSCTVFSGRGWHVYYMLDQILLDDFSPLLRKVASSLGSDRQVVDVTRFMRLPGSINLKSGKRCEVSSFTGKIYSEFDIWQAFGGITRGYTLNRPDLFSVSAGSVYRVYRSSPSGEFFFWQPSQPYKVFDGDLIGFDLPLDCRVQILTLGGSTVLYEGTLGGVPLDLVGYLSEIRLLA